MQFKSFMEALKGKQHKIDKNKNGQIDTQDFKMLQKEETIEESEERMARADYKTGPSGRKSHKEIVFNDAESKDDEDEDDKKEMKEAKMSASDMAERERIVKGMKKNLASFTSRYGARAKEVMYATATKQAMKEETVEEAVQKADIPAYLRKAKGDTPLKMSDLKRKDTLSDKENLARARGVKEEVEELDEKSEQAKQNKTMKNTMDASRGARFKLNNPVPDAEPKHKNARAHNVAIGRALRSEEKKEDPPFDGPYTKTKPAKNSDGTPQAPMSRARELAKQAMKQKMKEEFDVDMSDEQADSILEYIDEQAPIAPVPGQRWKDHAVMVNGKQRVVVPRKNVGNYPEHEGWKEVGPGQKMKESFDSEGNLLERQISYTEFAMMLEYETKDGRYVHKGTYGGNYVDPEGADDADDKKPKQQPAEKRGRGRPAGAKSGARKITGTSKLFK